MLCVYVRVIQPAYWIAQSCFAEYATDSQRATHAACVCVSCEGPAALTQRPNDAYDPCECRTTYRQNRNHTAFGLGIKTKHQHSDITYARCERGGKVGRWSRIARSNTTRSICVCVCVVIIASIRHWIMPQACAAAAASVVFVVCVCESPLYVRVAVLDRCLSPYCLAAIKRRARWRCCVFCKISWSELLQCYRRMCVLCKISVFRSFFLQ